MENAGFAIYNEVLEDLVISERKAEGCFESRGGVLKAEEEERFLESPLEDLVDGVLGETEGVCERRELPLFGVVEVPEKLFLLLGVGE